MTKIKNIELDLLFRIDFFALTNFGEDGYTDDEKFEEEKKDLKNSYGFSQYFQREIQGYEYVRLSDLEKDTKPYIEYLKSLDKKDLFTCCQLEQAIGLFHNGNLRAFLSTDTGICYNSPGHFTSVTEIIRNGESDLGTINTFYGKVVADSIELLYSPKSNNIDIDKPEGIVSTTIDRGNFEIALGTLRARTNDFFLKLKAELNSENLRQVKTGFVEEVFREIKTKA